MVATTDAVRARGHGALAQLRHHRHALGADRILAEVEELFAASCHRGEDGVEIVDLPYRTEAFRSIRR
jgi:hypothetical protein